MRYEELVSEFTRNLARRTRHKDFIGKFLRGDAGRIDQFPLIGRPLEDLDPELALETHSVGLEAAERNLARERKMFGQRAEVLLEQS